MTDLIDARILRLAQFPELGAAREDIGAGIRALVQSPYLVLYRFDIAADRVEIVRVVHGVRDLSGLF